VEVVRLIVDGADTVEGNADHGEGHYDGSGPVEEARGDVMEDADDIAFLVRGRSG